MVELQHYTKSIYNTPGTYDKCPQISHTKISDKVAYAKSADPDQTAGLHCLPFH